MTLHYALYRFYDQEENLLYVGISLSVARRFSQHVADKPWIETVTKITVQWCEDKSKALEAEYNSIQAEKPRFNVANSKPSLRLKHKKKEKSLVVHPPLLSDNERDLLFYPTISRPKLMVRFGLTKNQVLKMEKQGLPVYGIGHTRIYFINQFLDFIKKSPLKAAA